MTVLAVVQIALIAVANRCNLQPLLTAVSQPTRYCYFVLQIDFSVLTL
jgi:fibrillarin-like rRNA methylase